MGNTGQAITQKPDHIGDSQSSTALYANGHGHNGDSNVGHPIGMSGTSLANRDGGKETSDSDEAGTGSYLLLQVSDTGVGMDEQIKANMLQPFFTAKAGKCRGLGYTLVYETVRLHGGKISVRSDPGIGTCVDIHLPVANQTQGQLINDTSESDDSQGSLLLVVDDDDMVRMNIQKMLDHLGYETVPASSGEEAITVYEASQDGISAVILDVTMPGIGGLETSRRLKAINSEVRIILASGDPGSLGTQELELLGIYYLIAKPFRTEELSRAVHKGLEHISAAAA